MGDIRIKHPNLSGREIDVPAESWPHHAKAGWELVDQPTPAPTAPADPEPSADPESPKRRGRLSKESD